MKLISQSLTPAQNHSLTIFLEDRGMHLACEWIEGREELDKPMELAERLYDRWRIVEADWIPTMWSDLGSTEQDQCLDGFLEGVDSFFCKRLGGKPGGSSTSRPACAPSAGADVPPDEWKTMDTAPTNGDVFLAFRHHAQTGYQFVCTRSTDGRWLSMMTGEEEKPMLWRHLPKYPSREELRTVALPVSVGSEEPLVRPEAIRLPAPVFMDQGTDVRRAAELASAIRELLGLGYHESAKTAARSLQITLDQMLLATSLQAHGDGGSEGGFQPFGLDNIPANILRNLSTGQLVDNILMLRGQLSMSRDLLKQEKELSASSSAQRVAKPESAVAGPQGNPELSSLLLEVREALQAVVNCETEGDRRGGAHFMDIIFPAIDKANSTLAKLNALSLSSET